MSDIHFVNYLLLGFITYVTFLTLRYNNIENYVNRNKILFKRCNKYAISSVLSEVFKNNNIEKADCSKDDKQCNWDIYLPCGYNGIESELLKVKTTNGEQIIFGIKGCDKIVSKNSLWSLLKNKYGREGAQQFMPDSYVLSDETDMEEFKKTAKKGDLYILKKNVQRQTGLKITGDINEILSYANDSQYRVAQYLLQDPFIISGRKINLRVYVLFICNKNGTKQAFVHTNGFIYYTPKSYKPGSIDHDINITSGYVPRVVYEENPMTLKELRTYLYKDGHSPDTLFNNINNLIKNVMDAIGDSLCSQTVLNNNTSFQLFGADVAPNDKLVVHLMEINKGPDMSSKDKRDRAVKIKVQEDIFDKLGILKSKTPNEFIPVWNN